jgi:hypothetical protein
MAGRELMRLTQAALLAALLGLSSRAAAEEPGGAEQLFERGVAALQAGDYPAACPALEQSHAKEPALGALLALAECLDKWGKLHSAALRHEQIIAEISRLDPAQREYRAAQLEYARAAAERLWRSVPRLSLLAPSTSGTSGAELELFLDGRELPATGAELAVDPGAHTLETRARGFAPWTQTLDVMPGEHRRVQLQLGTPHVAPAAPPPAPPSTAQREPAATEPAAGGSGWRTLGWTLGGVGVAGAAAGTLAGALLLDACPGLACRAGDQRARDLALATDIGFGVAVVGLVSATLLLVQTSPGPDRAAQVRSQPLATLGPGSAWVGWSQPW